MGEIRVPRNMFLWSMAIVYMLAFSSLYVQLPGLHGNGGVSPVRPAEPPGLTGLPLLDLMLASPRTVLLDLARAWGADPPQALELVCLTGALLALGAATLAPLRGSLVFLALWCLYFSLGQVGRGLLSSPWDGLLLEAGFLAVLVAPLSLLGRQVSSGRHDPMTFWLTRWLLFRLTFGSGVAKLAGHSAPWWNLSAVSHMLESQASPTALAWWAAQLPSWVLRLGTVGVLVSQVLVPLLYFAPIRCLRITAFYVQLVHQLLSALTGNLTVLNLLTVALGFSLLDTEHTMSKKKRAAKTWGQTLVWVLTLLVELGVYVLIIYSATRLFQIDVDWEARTVSSKTAFTQQQFGDVLRTTMGSTVWIAVLSLTWEVVGALLSSLCVRGFFWKLWALVQWAVFAAATVAMFAVSVVPYTSMEPWSSSKVLPVVKRAHEWVKPYQLVSSYALDRQLAAGRGRPELVLEGSMDQHTWTEIHWMYKPGNVSAPPPLVAPYEARLDWQMWRAAQGQAQESPWFCGLVLGLLQGNKNVERLLQTDPSQYAFSEEPPAYLRATLYHYQFTQQDPDGSGPKQWWRRDFVKDFCPIVYLGDPDLQAMLSLHGLDEESPPSGPSHSPLARLLALLRGPRWRSCPGPHVQWVSLPPWPPSASSSACLSRAPAVAACAGPPAEPKVPRRPDSGGPRVEAPAGPRGRRRPGPGLGRGGRRWERSPRRRK
ncbi:lipase maturation factor 2b [Gadus chalcogrammus]|uniref:lipase maturation factor 2b n=1 Tax=Gadus chalcogrammus TaxID=1042646 RepID=UPI0024C2C52E|nr:lipase maturation factor 2b [Gadus chalcogrammus]